MTNDGARAPSPSGTRRRAIMIVHGPVIMDGAVPQHGFDRFPEALVLVGHLLTLRNLWSFTLDAK